MEISLINRLRELHTQHANLRAYLNKNRVIAQHSELYSIRETKEKREAMNRFSIHYEPIAKELFRMNLDFNPILKAFNLNPMKETFMLSHWNVGPRVPTIRLGEFGFYCADRGNISYKVVPHEIINGSVLPVAFLQIERTDVLPTAVLLHRGCKLIEDNDAFLIEEQD